MTLPYRAIGYTAFECERDMRKITHGERGCANPDEHLMTCATTHMGNKPDLIEQIAAILLEYDDPEWREEIEPDFNPLDDRHEWWTSPRTFAAYLVGKGITIDQLTTLQDTAWAVLNDAVQSTIYPKFAACRMDLLNKLRDEL